MLMEKSRIKGFGREHARACLRSLHLYALQCLSLLLESVFLKNLNYFKKINMFFIIFLNYFDVLMSKIILKK
jgi:hypothetical protein